jgi:hypothetical protein
MRRLTVLGVSLAMVLSASLATGEDLEEAVADHEDHPGLIDAAGDAGHQHGDADDHHETPESPCHHHETHLCCSHAPALAPGECAGVQLSQYSQRFIPPAFRVDVEPSVRRTFHVPIA